MPTPPRPQQAVAPPGGPARLEQTLRRLDDQRELLVRRRRRNLLIVGVSISLLLHLGLMLYLNLIRRAAPAGPVGEPVSLELAVIPDQQLTERETLELEVPEPEVDWEQDLERPAPELAVDPEAGASSLEITDAAGPALSGGGGGEGEGLGGGGGGTTFFGVSSTGTRFAYIVDISGSMGQDRKIDVCMRELARSIEQLPDHTYFYVVLFASEFYTPPMQEGWTRARDAVVSRLIRWLNRVDPGGGTQPGPAFHRVFALGERPDVVFFLTDGQIPPDTVPGVAGLNSRGRRVIVNTIAFGDPTSQALLKDIARMSGGVYRFVPR